jgi:excisionase family DNA binding protein
MPYFSEVQASMQLLKTAEVATRLNCSPSFVYDLIATGRLKHHRLGRGQGGVRVSEDQLQEYLQTTERGGAAGPRPAATPPVQLKYLSAKPD